MIYPSLKKIATAKFHEADCCYDCGEILHFVKKDSDIKGQGVAIHKQTGKILPFVLCIEDGMVTKNTLLDFETGNIIQEDAE